MREWTVRDVVLVLSFAGWMGLAAVGVMRGQPLPTMPLFPMRAQHREYPPAPRSVDPLLLQEPSDGEEEYGVAAVDSINKCYGKNCVVSSLRTNGAPPPGGTGLSAGGRWAIGSFSANAAGIWMATTNAPTATNYILLVTGGGTGTFLNGASAVALSQGGSQVFTCTTASCVLSAAVALNAAGAALTTGAACTAKTLQYDTGDGCWKVCNVAATWSGCLIASGGAGVVANNGVWNTYCEKNPCTKAEAAADAFLMPLQPGGAGITPGRISCNARNAGTGGTTGMVLAIWNATDSTELCNCAMACTAASGVVQTCTPSCAAFTAAKNYVLRLKSTTDCATIPGLLGCGVSLSQ